MRSEVTASPSHRPIRSYVLRQGRFSPAQQRARAELLPRYGIAFARAAIDFDATFGRIGPRILEIGFGMGETTAAIAEAMPAHDFIAVDVHGPGVGTLYPGFNSNTAPPRCNTAEMHTPQL